MAPARRRSILAGAFVSVAIAYFVVASDATADQVIPTTMDAIVLRADAIVAATVTDIDKAVGDNEAVDVRLAMASWLVNRLGSEPSYFRMRGIEDPPGSVRYRFDGRIHEGRRYVFFLRGGDWTQAPFATSSYPFIALGNAGAECPGGHIYGLATTGFLCSAAADQVGPPLSEAELVASLSLAHTRARQRRPELAAESDGAVRPFELVRTLRGTR